MELSKLRSLFRGPRTEGVSAEPQVGFKLTFCETSKKLTVKVIAARHLPTHYGLTKPHGYLVKIRVFPEREKYDTSIQPQSWPTFNEEFIFTLHSSSKDFLTGKFLSLTVYAVLENLPESTTSRPKRDTLRRFLSFRDKEHTKFRRSFRHSLNSRRTIGAATYNLDPKSFTQRITKDMVSTPDIWREVKELTSGIQTEPREGKNGGVEVTLTYSVSEDGRNDVVEVSVTKFRCSLQTMQDHEKLGGQLYIKINAFEEEDVIQKMKSDKFNPTISLKIEHNSATLRAKVNKHSIEHVKIWIRLISRNVLSKKTHLGKIHIDRNSELWKAIVAAPSTPITRMINFE